MRQKPYNSRQKSSSLGLSSDRKWTIWKKLLYKYNENGATNRELLMVTESKFTIDLSWQIWKFWFLWCDWCDQWAPQIASIPPTPFFSLSAGGLYLLLFPRGTMPLGLLDSTKNVNRLSISRSLSNPIHSSDNYNLGMNLQVNMFNIKKQLLSNVAASSQFLSQWMKKLTKF